MHVSYKRYPSPVAGLPNLYLVIVYSKQCTVENNCYTENTFYINPIPLFPGWLPQVVVDVNMGLTARLQ